jgi:hypothetical protein
VELAMLLLVIVFQKGVEPVAQQQMLGAIKPVVVDTKK